MEKDGSITVDTQTKPKEADFWQATNPKARDFRLLPVGKAYKLTFRSFATNDEIANGDASCTLVQILEAIQMMSGRTRLASCGRTPGNDL